MCICPGVSRLLRRDDMSASSSVPATAEPISRLGVLLTRQLAMKIPSPSSELNFQNCGQRTLSPLDSLSPGSIGGAEQITLSVWACRHSSADARDG